MLLTLLVSHTQNSRERALTSGLSKTVRFAEHDFSGIATGELGTRPTIFPKDRLWDSSKSHKKSETLLDGGTVHCL